MKKLAPWGSPSAELHAAQSINRFRTLQTDHVRRVT
jgi:hypothetical protein